MKKQLMVLALLLSMVMVLPACGSSSGEESDGGAEVVTLSLGDSLPMGHWLVEELDTFAEEVYDKSGGTIEIVRYPNGELFDATGMYDAGSTGGVDIALQSGVFAGAYSSRLEFVSGFVTLTLYDSRAHYHRVLDRPEVKEMAAIAAEEDINQKLLGVLSYGTGGVASKVPIRTVEDYEGIRVLAGGEPQSKMFAAAGAVPTPLAMSEAYVAIERGTLDATGTGLSSYIGNSYYEVAPYLVEFYDTHDCGFFLTMNLDKWNTLSQEQQQIITEIADALVITSRARAEIEDELLYEKIAEEYAEEVIFWTPEEAMRLREITQPHLVEIFNKRVGEETASMFMNILEEER